MPARETGPGNGGKVAGQAIRWTTLALAFLLELCALGALGYWGIRTGGGLPGKAAFGLAVARARDAAGGLRPGRAGPVLHGPQPSRPDDFAIAVLANGVLVSL